jgi:hypothetical protein
MDKLERIFALQKELRKKIGGGVDFTNHLNDKGKGKWTLQYLACLSNEIEELRSCFYWKHWTKEAKEQDLWNHPRPDQIQNIPVEIVDMLFFLVDLCSIHNIDAEKIFDLYQQKYIVNMNRQKNKYSMEKKNEDDNKEIK